MLMRVAVYLGSHDGTLPAFCETAYALGRTLAQKGIGVVYGGANVGTMAALAEGVKSASGECIGVFPEGFKGRPDVARTGRDIRQDGLSQFIVVKDFAERKQTMEDLSDCCVALPGSWGTMDELFAYATSTQLGFNGGKGVYVLNVNGYYDSLAELIENMYRYGFVDDSARHLIRVCNSIDELLSYMGVL